MSYKDKGKITRRKIPKWAMQVLPAVAILLIEIFVWNRSYWFSLGYQPISVEEIFTQTGETIAPGSSYLIGQGSVLEIRDIDRDIKNIYLNIETEKEKQKDTLSIRFGMTDEGSKNYYDVPPRVISSRLQKLNYISLYPYGKLKSLKISFPGEENTKITIMDFVFNQKVPMSFSFWRVILMYFLYLFVRTFFFRPYQRRYKEDSKQQKLVTAGICLLSVTMVFALTARGVDEYGMSTMDKYKNLAHSLAEGKCFIEMDIDERFLNLENPYDRTQRAEEQMEYYMWDYTYFEGRMYVYFGIVPVIVTYLPYYLLTGKDLNHIVPYLLFLAIFIVGICFLMEALVKKYCRGLPLKLYYLFQITFLLGVGTFIFAKRVCIYNLPILSGLGFTAWGLYLWISSQVKTDRYVNWKVFLGAVCMALVAGCRPQLLMGSFLAIPIFWDKIKQSFSDLKAKKGIKIHAAFYLLFLIPYLIIAVLIMRYNDARFGSPFEFGAVYTLTTNDMRYRGMHAARLVSGIWSFLFQLPNIKTEFPFLHSAWLDTVYQGIHIQENNIGGLFATNLILLPCFFVYYYRKKLQEKRALMFTAVCMASGMVIVAADIQMAGVLTRYMADFGIFFYMAAFMVIFAVTDSFAQKKFFGAGGETYERIYFKVIAFLCSITILYWFLSLLSLYVVTDYDIYQSVWYYHLKEVFDVFHI